MEIEKEVIFSPITIKLTCPNDIYLMLKMCDAIIRLYEVPVADVVDFAKYLRIKVGEPNQKKEG